MTKAITGGDQMAAELCDAIDRATAAAVLRGGDTSDLLVASFAYATAAARVIGLPREDARRIFDRCWALDEIHQEAAEIRRAGRLH